jgi:hypothetical protein
MKEARKGAGEEIGRKKEREKKGRLVRLTALNI